MALKLVANYSKKIGLPEYSSHSFSVSVEVELTDLSQVENEVQHLYKLLQTSVDQEIQEVGFVPSSAPKNQSNGRYRSNGTNHHQNGNGNHDWNCTEGQRTLILKILRENQMDQEVAEDLAKQLFTLPVAKLDKMQASQLIEDLLVKAGKPKPRQWSRRK